MSASTPEQRSNVSSRQASVASEVDENEAEAIRNTFSNTFKDQTTHKYRSTSQGTRRIASSHTSEPASRLSRVSSHLESLDEHSSLLASTNDLRNSYEATNTQERPQISTVNSRPKLIGRRSRKVARATSYNVDQDSTHESEGVIQSIFRDDRIWYDQFTSIDWVYDSIEDARRTKQLKSRKDLKGRVISFLDDAQEWMLSLLVGCVIAGIAYLIDITEASVFDIKSGYCSGAWWLKRRACCANADDCDRWIRWSEIFHLPQWFNVVAYVFLGVVFAVLSCLITLQTRTTISPTNYISSVDEQYDAHANHPPHRALNLNRKDHEDYLSPASRFRAVAARPMVTYYSAAGSGVPEVRVILAGFVLHGYLGVRTLITKSVGLILSIASGLSIGKEGPFVHIGACVGNVASRLSVRHRNNDSKRREVISAAAGAGVAVAFGAPIAGVLFSLEEVSYYFPRKMLFRTFFCTIAAALSLKFLNPYGTNKIVLFEVRYVTDWRLFELGIFCLLGALGGTIGALFIKASRFWAQKVRGPSNMKKHPVLEVAVVALITGIASFWNRYTRIPVAELLYELAAPCQSFESNADTLCPTEDKIPVVIGLLSIAFVVKALLTTITFGIKVPAGIYVPAMVVGGYLGRIVGHALQALTSKHPKTFGCPVDGGLESCVVPGVYALVAAGATMCGVTRLSITLAVILFELTGSLDHVLPFSLGVLIAKWTADALEPLSIYDLLTDMNGYPYIDAKDRPMFNTDLGDLTPALDPKCVIDISPSPVVPASLLRTKLEYMQMSGELDGGLPIVKDEILVGLIPGPSLEFALDNLQSEEEQEYNILCLMDPRLDWTRSNRSASNRLIDDDVSMSDAADVESVKSTKTVQIISPPAKPSDPTDFTGYIDRAPIALDIYSPMDLVFECFTKMGLRYICVLKEGKLVGLVHKKEFVRYVKNLQKEE